jgi:hypothetical protein
LTFLLVNLIYYPTSERADQDQKLAELSMLHLQKYFDFKGLEKFRQLRNVLVQIETVAKSALREARREQSSDNSDDGEITGLQSKYPFDPAFFPHTLPSGDIFDINFQDMVSTLHYLVSARCSTYVSFQQLTMNMQTNGEPISAAEMGQPVFNSMDVNLASAGDTWQSVYDTNSFWGFGAT